MDSLTRASKRGAFVLLSNADFVGIYDLYKAKGFRFTSISRPSLVSGKSAARGFYGEVLISNYPLRIRGDSDLFTQMECREEEE